MKGKHTKLFIAISSVALLLLLVIQVNWIIRTAAIKEELFNEKANMVLSRTTEALRVDKETCRKIEACVDKNKTLATAAKLGNNETYIIDSLFRYYMRLYNIRIGYSFEVARPKAYNQSNGIGFANFSYNKPLQDVANSNGVELKLVFPEKKQFIMAEMGGMFISSVILVLVVLVLFWRTVLSLLKEKKISEHTTEFLNNMTHEFKTPLTNIALAGKMLQKDSTTRQEEKIKHYTGIILEENEKLRSQVEQVLSMSALERGEIPLLKVSLDFHGLIREAVKRFNLQIENKLGKIELYLNAHSFRIQGDKLQLENVIGNLVDNAVKYSGIPELVIETRNEGPNLVISVADKGIGIDKEFQKDVFDKYYRVPTGDVHDVKGFGLGLAYVSKILALHSGTIALQSEKGIGTKFTITLPNA